MRAVAWCAVFAAAALPGWCADPAPAQSLSQEQLAGVAVEYTRRLGEAVEEMASLRAQVLAERTPLANEVREQTAQVSALEDQVERLRAGAARAANDKRLLDAEWEAATRNTAFLRTQARELVANLNTALLPGEEQALGMRISELQKALEEASTADVRASIDALELLVGYVHEGIGGRVESGAVLRSQDNGLERGRFAFFGPDVYFRGESGLLGIVRPREGSPYPVVHVVPQWDGAAAGDLFSGGAGSIVADVSGGKALRLLETKASPWETVQKAGEVGYVILALGGLAVVLTILKVVDIRGLRIDAPARVEAVTGALARGAAAEAEAATRSLAGVTRDMYQLALRAMHGPRALLEETLEGYLMRLRLHHERRLPLLAVIATAGPLLGLLGTVTGMIKTFTLITVFGTGSAARLSSGISEALVATELGLAVAIPTLVIHGFLAHRIHKGLATVERYAMEFVTAVETSRSRETVLPAGEERR